MNYEAAREDEVYTVPRKGIDIRITGAVLDSGADINVCGLKYEEYLQNVRRCDPVRIRVADGRLSVATRGGDCIVKCQGVVAVLFVHLVEIESWGFLIGRPAMLKYGWQIC